MAHDPAQYSPVFSIDVSAEATSNAPPRPAEVGAALIALTRQLIESQQKQNLLLDQILQVNKQVLQASNQANSQRQNELTQWRNAHPKLVRSCKEALETLSTVQTGFLQNLADEVADSKDIGCKKPISTRVPVGRVPRVTGVIEDHNAKLFAVKGP